MRFLHVVLVSALLWCAASALCQPALAQSAEEQALARELFEEGVGHAQERRWSSAADSFSRSYALAPRDSTLFNLASALTQAGRLVEARERYRSYLASSDDEALRGEAERAIEAIEPRLARVRLTFRDLQPVDVVYLDGETLNHAALGAAIPADPGDHQIRVERGDTELISRALNLAEGQASDLTLTVPSLEPEQLPYGLPDPDADLREIDEDESGVLSSPWFWITLGALLVAGGVVAAVLLVNESQRLSLYEGTTDPPTIGLP